MNEILVVDLWISEVTRERGINVKMINAISALEKQFLSIKCRFFNKCTLGALLMEPQ